MTSSRSCHARYRCCERMRGFTLIQLLLGLGAAAVAVFWLAPVSDQELRNQLEQERLRLAQGIAMARTQAVQRSTSIRLCRNITGACGNTSQGSFAWNTGWRVVPHSSPGQALHIVEKQNPAVSLSYDCGDFLVFGAEGRRIEPPEGDCTFRLTTADSDIQLQLVVSPSGQVRQ